MDAPMRLEAMDKAATALALPRRKPRRSPRRIGAVAGVGLMGGTAFGVMAVASARRTVEPADRKIHARMRQGLDEAGILDAAEAAAPKVDASGQWWIYTPVAMLAAGAVLLAPAGEAGRRPRQPRIAGAAAIVLVPAAVSALSPLLDEWLPQPPVGPRRRPLDHPVFPSGHAFRTTAVAVTTAYVLAREGVLPRGAAVPAAFVASVVIGIARLIREKHLASDVLGGWAAGVTLASIASASYEIARGDSRDHGWQTSAP